MGGKENPVSGTPLLENRVLGLSGSPRRNGNSDLLLRRVLSAAEGSGVPTQAGRLADYRFDPCIGCERCRKDKACTGLRDGMQLLYPEVVGCRGLVLTCPTHHYNVTAWMKAFLDRLYCFYDFDTPRPGPWRSRLAGQGRVAAVVAVCEQADPEDMGFTLDGMRRPLEALGYQVIGALPVLRAFEKGAVSDRPEVLAACDRLGVQLAAALREP
ncbi:MAG: flavodoxin family protein [Deferrisomatales bacterium]